MADAHEANANADGDAVEFRALDGFFIAKTAEDGKADATPRFLQRFSLATESWAALTLQLDAACEAARLCSRQVKLLFLVRHAQGTHNVAERDMGTARWEAEGAQRMEYLDAELTEKGIADAAAKGPPAVACALQDGMPPIERIVCSPMSRAIRTAMLFFTSAQAPRPFICLELCRETIGVHTCDQRRPVSKLRAKFPDDIDCSKMRDDQDVLWTATHRETDAEQQQRAHRFLAQLFREIPDRVVVVSSHSGFINALWATLHDGRGFHPTNCEVVPLVVEADM